VPEAESIGRLGCWGGYRVGLVERFEAGIKGARAQVWIELRPDPNRVKVCDRCGGECRHIHDVSERWVRDLSVFDADTHLLVHRCRLECPSCGPSLERLSWLAPYARVTARLAESVARMCAVLPIKHVAEHHGLKWDAVKAIDKAHLEKTLGEPDLDGLTLLAMDEFAIHKGHRYATVVLDPGCKRVLWVGKGRDRGSLRPFFGMLGPERSAKIRAVAMDMNSAHEQEVRANCPHAQVVFDLFHVVAKYGREVIDRVRVDEANRLRDDKPSRHIIKSARWLLLRNRENIPRREDRVRLNELLKANKTLMTVYVLVTNSSTSGTSAPGATPCGTGTSGTTTPSAAASNRCDASPSGSRTTSTASSATAHTPSTPACSKASTTRSRSSNGWPTASAMTITSSSRSEPPSRDHSPEIPDDPILSRVRWPRIAAMRSALDSSVSLILRCTFTRDFYEGAVTAHCPHSCS